MFGESDKEYIEGLFSQRNKEYGAYQIRMGYAKRLKWSAAITFGALLLYIAGYYFSDYLQDDLFSDDSYMSNEIYLSQIQVFAAPNQKKLSMPKKETLVLTMDNMIDEGERKVKQEPKITKADSLYKLDSINRGKKAGAMKGDTANDGSNIYAIVDVYPKFPGGDEALRKFLKTNIRYPAEMQQKRIFGVVKVSFIINEQGYIKKIKVDQSVHPVLDYEVVRVAGLMPRWSPAYRNGRAVKFIYVMPVQFAPLVQMKK